MDKDNFFQRTKAAALGEKFFEASLIVGSLFLLGAWANMPDNTSKVASAGVIISSFSLAVVGITSWLNLMPPQAEKAWKGYMTVLTLLIYLASNGLSLGHITAGVVQGAKVVGGSVYDAGAGAVNGATATATATATTAFSDTDKGSYAGTAPCASLDWSKASNTNVQNGTGGAREWCAAGANALGGKASAKFAKTCGCQ